MRDLYLPTEITICGADITDEGLRVLGDLKSLESIILSNTKVTNAGLTPISKLPSLGQIWLEPQRAAKDLSDDGLAVFVGHPKLRYVTLADRGFTDASVEHLLKMPFVSDLRLTETSITPTGIAAIKKARPNTRFLSASGQ